MNTEQYLLMCLAEEASEVAQRASKAQRFGMEESQPGQEKTNRDRLIEELNDLISTAGLLLGEGWISQEQMMAKRVKIAKYMAYSRELGILDEPDNISLTKQFLSHPPDCLDCKELNDLIQAAWDEHDKKVNNRTEETKYESSTEYNQLTDFGHP